MIKTININTPISQWKPVLSGAHSVQMYNGGKEVGVQVLFTQGFSPCHMAHFLQVKTTYMYVWRDT